MNTLALIAPKGYIIICQFFQLNASDDVKKKVFNMELGLEKKPYKKKEIME